ncbi:IclR family transcriptional regulator [Luteipulveratus flavus]|uniref:IclR family transcriptional regulator n=1 Tax=Luteipulveratus flavus TaxID=3031728 RepID=A0ABT6C308_9MICO|nr:IclR family transcriptional regulator [Luteipulveratus sp. YIM 133296]MDF8263343.1 IclR family transcriptional regulator [Luteipulveratus sp. YIM 133296]
MTREPAVAAGSRRGGVQAVDRALDILEVLGDGSTKGVSELVRATELPLGTVHRLLATLAERGYVRQDSERRYAIGPAALGLADAGERSLAAVGRAYAARLTALCGETVNLAVLQGHEMVYVAQSPSPHSLRIFAEVGRRIPLHSTAVGKAVLASMGTPQAADLLRARPLTASTPRTLTTTEELDRELARVRDEGYAVDEEEQELGVRCVAAVVSSPGLHAALSVSGPTERFTVDAARAAAPQVRAVAADLATALRA